MVVLVLTQKIVSNIVLVHPLETKSVPKRQLASYISAITVDFMEVPHENLYPSGGRRGSRRAGEE
jgi:hypothetical protein